MRSHITFATSLLLATTLSLSGSAQQQGPPPGGRGPGGPIVMMGPGQQAERPIVAQFDKNKDNRLNADERREARLWLEAQPGPQRGGRGGRGGQMVGSPGPNLAPDSASVKKYGNEPLYDPSVLRTFFFQFENDDWEKEMMAFYNTDVEVPATLVVDGKTYKNVGLHFRGMSSFMGVPAGLKHSINVAMDFVDDKQTLLGYRTLNLLNSHVDPSMLRTVLFMQAAREYLPAPKANFARVVLNGESWGIYPNVQQYNKEFINEWFKTTDGARWKVPGSPGGRGGLEYVGDDPAAYKRSFEIKSKDDPKSWEALIRLCKTLNTTPPEQLEKALAPMLDIDQTLRFLAIDAALVNNDGYWTRASDYSIYLDPKGVFHVFPHDANETFGSSMGPPPPPPPPPGAAAGTAQGGLQIQSIGAPGGRGGGPRLGGAELDPLVGLNDVTKPLRSKLLAVPALRERYMTYVRQIATKWLDWNTLGPIAQRYQALIAADAKTDTRKLSSNEQFEAGLATLKAFADTRRAFLVK